MVATTLSDGAIATTSRTSTESVAVTERLGDTAEVKATASLLVALTVNVGAMAVVLAIASEFVAPTARFMESVAVRAPPLTGVRTAPCVLAQAV